MAHMRNLPGSFTMRKDRTRPSEGDWFRIVKNSDTSAPADVYIYDEIGFWGTTASDFVKELTQIDNSAINLHINSPGGEVFDGIAIYNALKQHKAQVTVYVDALAASAASFIAQAGDKIIMARNAQMMIHDGIGIAFGNEADMRETADLLGKVSNNIADIYAQRAGGTVEDWRALMKQEVWYTGQEAVDAGLADEVTKANEKADEATNKWDLSFYNFAGREQAEPPTRVYERLLVTNRSKENQMKGKPLNTDGSQPAESTETGQPPETTGDPQEPGTETQPAQPPVEEQPSTAPSTDPAPQNRNGVLINGQITTDWNAIQNHIASLENALNEREQQHRRDFVENLSNENKIAATQVEKLTAFALKLTPEQFSEWSASYDSAPKQSLFGSHGSTPTDSGRPASGNEAATDRIAVLEGTVAMLSRTMTPEKLHETNSYKELQQLKNTQNS